MSKVSRSYTFRAEFEKDVVLFLAGIQKWTLKVKMKNLTIPGPDGTPWPTPDREVVMEAQGDLSLANLRWIAEQITDCHVISESLQTSENYTGERTYGQVAEAPSRKHRRIIEEGLLDCSEFFRNEMERLAYALVAIEWIDERAASRSRATARVKPTARHQ